MAKGFIGSEVEGLARPSPLCQEVGMGILRPGYASEERSGTRLPPRGYGVEQFSHASSAGSFKRLEVSGAGMLVNTRRAGWVTVQLQVAVLRHR